MPIKPENKGKYPPNWKSEIRPAILERAENKCEFCGVVNHAIGARDGGGVWHDENSIHSMNNNDGWALWPDGFPAMVKIVLTIAHLDHDPTNNDPANLRALCQLCHNRYDVAHRQANRAATVKAKRAQQEMMV